jgi:hypothetical protein
MEKRSALTNLEITTQTKARKAQTQRAFLITKES